MRLINTESLKLESFLGTKIPPYAILSHTWEEEEVTLQDLMNGNPLGMKGWEKIEKTCRISLAEHDLKYAWVDTCCIDKTSSAELSEAINSMFRWYMGAQICYVYFSDLREASNDDEALANCRWFTRGWTLQELIASKNIHFYDRWWNLRGSKSTLLGGLSRITHISEEVLYDCECLPELPVAEKMSWAAQRITTLPEDMAYCLLGVFDISMPMLYGEGTKAFQRLQEEIIRKTNDMSIFAWKPHGPTSYRGVLSQSSKEFDLSSTIIKGSLSTRAPEFIMTNKGIRITTPLWEISRHRKEKRGYLNRDIAIPLDISSQKNRLLLLLIKFGPEQYTRHSTASLISEHEVKVLKSDLVETIYLSAYSSSQLTRSIGIGRENSVQVVLNGVGIENVSPRSHWDPRHSLFFLDPEETVFLLYCHLDSDVRPTSFVAPFIVIVSINYGHEDNTFKGVAIIEGQERINMHWDKSTPKDTWFASELFTENMNGTRRARALADLLGTSSLSVAPTANYERHWRSVSMNVEAKGSTSSGKMGLRVEINATVSGKVKKYYEEAFDLAGLSD